MRRLIVCAGVFAALALPPSMSASPAAPSGVKVRIVDTSCYGPCVEGAEHPLFQGEATVTIRDLGIDRRVAKVTVDDGRFRKRLRPGRYLLKPAVVEPGRRCYEGETDEVRLRGGGFERARLEVFNTCIV